MVIPMRTGKGRIEYNEEKLSAMSPHDLEEHLRVEMIRLFLKHPYERQPLGARADALHGGSDLVISSAYKPSSVRMLTCEEFNLPSNQSFEWYVRELDKLMANFISPLSDESEGMINDGGGAPDDTDGESNHDNELHPLYYQESNSDEQSNDSSASESNEYDSYTASTDIGDALGMNSPE